MSIVAKKIMMGSGAVGDPVDDQFNRVSFLSHFDGANSGVNNVFDDGSASNHTITANGDVTQGSFGPFARPDGEWGVSFDGSGDRLRTNSSNLDITTEAFTAEAWIFPVSNMDQYDIIVCMFASSHGSNANQTWSIRAGANNTIEIVTISSGTQTTQSAGTANIGAWNHVAISRNGTTMYAALNGVVTSASCASSLNGHEYFYIGAADANGSGAYFFNGVISNVRYEIGNARYTSNYTVPTSKLTATTNTKILTCQSNRFVDNSTLNNTFLISGNPAVTAFGPFLTSSVYSAATNGASAYLDGDGDDLVAADSSDFELGSGDFTISMWIYPDSISPTNTVEALISHASHSAQLGWSMWWQTNSGLNRLRFFVNGGARQYETNVDFTGNQWTYVTAVRTGNTLKLFVNGVEGLSTSFADFTNYTGTLTIGSSTNWNSNYPFSGYLSDVRVVKGTAVYTSAFTPPTAPLTAITNTKLLLNMADAQAIDSAAQNNLTLFGTAKLSTAQKKFGTASLLLDGNSDYVAIPAINLTGSFTLEFFAYLNAWPNSSNFDMFYGQASSVYMCFTSGINGSGSDRSIQLAYDPSGYSGITQFNVNSAMNAGAWHHVAITKNSSNVHVCYIDGTAVTATNATKANTFFTTGTHFIGRGYSPSYHYFGGYIDDFRISQLVRYTSNFTAPTEPFPDKGQ